MTEPSSYSPTFRRLATAATFAALFAFALTGTIAPAAENQICAELFHNSKTLFGYIFAIWTVGFVPCVLLGGRYSDKRGKLPVLGTGCLLMAIGSYGFSHAHTYAMAFLMVFVIGAGGGFSEGISMAVIADVFEARSRTSMMNGSQVFYAIGAVVGPIGVSQLLAARLDWRLAYDAATFFCVLGAVFSLAGMARREERPSAQEHSGSWRTLLRDPLVLVLALGIVLYTGAEAGQGCWLAAYFKEDLHTTGPVAARTVALFWAGIGLGRLITTWTARHLSDYAIACMGLGLAALCQIALLVTHSPSIALAAVPMLGFALAPVWPTIVSRASALHPMQTGMVLGIVVAGGSFAAGVTPAAIGQAADRIGLRHGLWICVALLAINFMMFAALWMRKRARSTGP